MTYCIKKGTETWISTEECRRIRDEAVRVGRYAKGQIGLTSQKFTNGKDKSGGYSARVWIMCDVHPEDETFIPYHVRTAHTESSHSVLKGEVVELDGNELFARSAEELDIDFAALVVKSAIWAPDTEHIACGKAAKYPRVRRKRPYEKRGHSAENIRLDDNRYPNSQMKAVLRKAYNIQLEAGTFETCHVWPNTCYDERYHTCFANLVMLPRALAALSDHNEHVQRVLQYRAYELFNWYPAECEVPTKPENYPTDWFRLQR